MAAQCVMCGRSIATGILCDKCDRPRKSAPAKSNQPATTAAPAQAAAVDPFPEAPVVPFPVESTSVGPTSMREVLAATRVPAILLSSDGSVRFASDEARQLLGVTSASAVVSARDVESKIGSKLPEPREATTLNVNIGGKPYAVQAIPLSGGAGGSALIFRNSGEAVPASVMNFVGETILAPLRALADALMAAAAKRTNDPILEDAASTIEQILSSLELTPVIQEKKVAKPVPTIAEVIQRLTSRFAPLAKLKGVQLQVDMPEMPERFRDHEELSAALGFLLENSLHYVPNSGQVVLGVRLMEHKGKPLLLFFVMDNGPIVPEEMRETIFAPDFNWDPGSSSRSGRGLARARKFALAHGGQIWVESKTGKACTFFLRVRPDGPK